MSNSMFPSVQLRGCHHCIGAAHTVTETIFRIIESRAIANGGMISVEDITNARVDIIESLSSSVDSFEKIHQECMDASGSYAPDPFSRDMILSTLLLACGERSAKQVFKVQIEKCGPEWLSYFFYAFAKVARDHLSHESKVHLIIAYADASGKFKSNLTVLNLLNEAGIKEILLECVASISKAAEIGEVSKSTCGRVNEFIATKYNFTGPYITKITTDQMKQYFVMLQKETELSLQAA
jgi:hypothetical protein